jgi:hypothetical protein
MLRKCPRLARFLLWSILGSAGIAVLLVATIQIEQRVFRYRAERRYEDVMAIQLRHTTFEQLGPFLEHWNGNVSRGEPCFKQHCDLTIRVRRLIFMPGWDARFFDRFRKFDRRLGGRFSEMLARISVRNGVVWGKDYAIGLDVGPVKNDDARMFTYFSEFRISTIPRTDASRLTWPAMRKNPEFEIRLPSKCWECVDVKFSPYADPKDIRRLSHFNFSSLTARRPCRDRQEIAPAVVAELSTEGPHQETEKMGCDLGSVRILARDTQNAAVFDVTASRKVSPEPFDERRILTARLVQRLKRTLFWNPGQKVEVEIYDGMPALPPLEFDNNVRPGDRLILLFLRRPDLRIKPDAGAETGGVVPYSDENMAVVRAGAAEADHVEPLVEYDPGYQPHTGSDLPGPAPMMPEPPQSKP